MNRSITFPSPTGTVLARAAAAIASLTLATALTSCSFSVGELEPIDGEESATTEPTADAEPDATEQGGESPVADTPDTGDTDTAGGLPMDASQAQAWAEDNYWLSGSGEAFYRLDWTASTATVLELTHSGTGNFIISPYSEGGEGLGSIVNEIGVYEGSVTLTDVLIGATPEEVAYLHIRANGPWTIGR
ncbi:hypothetical protein [Nocardiopsis sp. CC223A]|uniref:hypothetical protein n=1 Tax=Nocardiopsis sp. CC223A TaxID=3044051 RepID=UPI00278C4B78|nr:hypothetical protein [Nocardiopsis sp. CC223A]